MEKLNCHMVFSYCYFLGETVDGGKVSASISGIPHSASIDLCSHLPTPCPINKGSHKFKFQQFLPNFIPKVRPQVIYSSLDNKVTVVYFSSVGNVQYQTGRCQQHWKEIILHSFEH